MGGMLLTDDVNVNLFLSHFDEFLRAGGEYEILIAKIGDEGADKNRRVKKGVDRRVGEIDGKILT